MSSFKNLCADVSESLEKCCFKYHCTAEKWNRIVPLDYQKHCQGTLSSSTWKVWEELAVNLVAKISMKCIAGRAYHAQGHIISASTRVHLSSHVFKPSYGGPVQMKAKHKRKAPACCTTSMHVRERSPCGRQYTEKPLLQHLFLSSLASAFLPYTGK